MQLLLLTVALVVLSHGDPAVGDAIPPPQAQKPEDGGGGGGTTRDLHILSFDACKEDIYKYCNHAGVDLKSDISIVECLQDAGQSETAILTKACESLVWDFKIKLTQDERFTEAARLYCDKELKENAAMAKCIQMTEPGYALSCIIDFIGNITKTTRCYQFLYRTERLAFSDFRLIGPFIRKCESALKKFDCNVITPNKAHEGVRVPHTQGMALECLISNVVKHSKDQPNALDIIDTECRHEVMRLAEMQSDDFHLDRPLFFACRSEREKFCKEVPAGQGKVFECLIMKRHHQEMDPECSKILVERAHLMGQDYRMAHPLTKACNAEMEKYSCLPQKHLEAAVHFHMSWILLCIENGAKTQPDKPPSPECIHELLQHRQMMMTEFKMAPELVMNCAQEIDTFCSPKGDIEMEGRTIHCLMGIALKREKDEKKKLGPQCMQSLGEVIKVVDIGSNYKVDNVLYASCKNLIDGPCAQDAASATATLTCLMKNVDSDQMNEQCEKRLLEVQYFMARDWTLDPELYQACHAEAVSRCSAFENWHMQTNDANRVDPGPQVLACLYRSAYDEEHPLSVTCNKAVRRVLRTRAVRVNLIPDIEDACRDALSEYCSHNVKPQEEMQCLQDHFEEKDFMKKYATCYSEVKKFTQMESKDTKLNQLLVRACKPVIQTYCGEFINEDIDHGDVLECLVNNKNSNEMNNKCRSYVQHFELVSLRDYHFNFKFETACAPDIDRYCKGHGNDKGTIIRCLSEVMFEHRVLGKNEDLNKECKKQLKVAYLQQEKVDSKFDDVEHIKDADPELIDKCGVEIKQLKCDLNSNFEDMVECLREKFDRLGPNCKAYVFDREKFEAADNTFDDELQKSCISDVKRYCTGQPPDRILDCLSNTKIVRMLKEKCRKVVHERMLEQARDIRLRPGLLSACKEEAEQYCPEDYKKIHDSRYQEKTLEGVLVGCLREQFRKSAGHDKPHFKQECKQEIYRVIVESEFDVRLDPPLYMACSKVIDQHCSAVVLQKGGHFDNVLECLKADFYSGAIMDKECNQELARRTEESLVDIHLDPVLHEACALDIKRYCFEVPPGNGRVISCLMDASESENKNVHLTSECKTKLHERHQLWMKAHADYQMMLPESFQEFVNAIQNHPHKVSLLGWFAAFIFCLFLIGCCCGRMTKRVARELKNR